MYKPKSIQREPMAPAWGGTLNVLAAVDRCASVTCVVLPSSVAARYDHTCDLTTAPIISTESGKYDPSLALAFKIGKLFGQKIEDIFQAGGE